MLLDAPEMTDFRPDMVTDFRSTLVSRRMLERDELVLEIQYRAEGEDEPRDDATKYRVRLQYTSTLTVAQLAEYLTSTNLNARSDETLPVIQAFNIFLNHHAKSAGNLATIRASKSFSLSPTAARWDLGAGLTAIRGFFSSVRVAACRILVNVNVSHGAFYDAIPLDRLILKYNAAHRSSKRKLDTFLKSLKVRTTHLPEKKNRVGQVVYRIKTIVGLATKNDGHGLAHPPRVKDYGAGSKDVEFWLDSAPPPSSRSATGSKGGSKKKGEKGSPSSEPSMASSSGQYISVYDFFLNSKWPSESIEMPS